jgi:hypothetical protein
MGLMIRNIVSNEVINLIWYIECKICVNEDYGIVNDTALVLLVVDPHEFDTTQNMVWKVPSGRFIVIACPVLPEIPFPSTNWVGVPELSNHH